MTAERLSEGRTRVAIVGGGVAAIEAMLAIGAIAEQRDRWVEIEMFAPRKDFVMKPLGVLEAFGEGDVLTFDLEDLAGRAGATFHLRGVTGIDRKRRLVRAHDDEEYPYDYLVVATGTKALWVVPGARTFWGLQGQEVITDLLATADESRLERLILTMPEPAVWPLPAYELALFIAARFVKSRNRPSITIVTPETEPLHAFGRSATERIVSILDDSSITLVTGVTPLSFSDDQLQTSAGPIPADRVITLPRLIGRRVRGLPFDENGFLPVDGSGLIEDCEREYAAGDVIAYPVKFGGAATAQADVVAEAIGARAWGTPEPEGFELKPRATLLTPDGPVSLVGEPAEKTWHPAEKVSGRYLTPFLMTEKERT